MPATYPVLPPSLSEEELRAAGRCGAKLKRVHDNGALRCHRIVTPGRGRCSVHGGYTPRGLDRHDAHFRQYRGTDLPPRLGEAFLAALTDPALTSLAQELALVDVRAGELVAKLPTGESGAAWAEVQGARVGLGEALRADPPDAVTALGYLARLEQAADVALQERALWGELYEALEARRRLAESERKREEALEAALTARQAAQLIGAIVAAVAEIVRDPAEKLALSARIAVLLDEGGARARRAARRLSAVEVEAEEVDPRSAEEAPAGRRGGEGAGQDGRQDGPGNDPLAVGHDTVTV